jgi:hypothetical protein
MILKQFDRARLVSLVTAAIVGSALAAAQVKAPPRELLREVAAHGTQFEQELGRYLYRQKFQFFELDKRGAPGGHYSDVRDILFDDEGERTESFVGHPVSNLNRIRLTEEDFRDIREVQPFVLTEDNLWIYETQYKGEEAIEGEPCYVFRIQPRQVLEGLRLLDGLVWISIEHHQVVKVAGKPLPQIYKANTENLFPNFSTVYAPVDGKYWFPVRTLADDFLPFSSGAQHVRYTIEYLNYKRFGAESSIQFEAEPAGKKEHENP